MLIVVLFVSLVGSTVLECEVVLLVSVGAASVALLANLLALGGSPGLLLGLSGARISHHFHLLLGLVLAVEVDNADLLGLLLVLVDEELFPLFVVVSQMREEARLLLVEL